MEDLQFRRTYELIIGEPNTGKGLQIIGDEAKNLGLELSFKIKKHIDNKEESNTCVIDIVNFSESSINYIQRDSMSVILKVGYNNNNKILFRGMISEVETDDGANRQDRKTSLTCVPADALVYQPTISKTFPPKTTPRQIISYLVGQSTTIARASFNSTNIDYPFDFGYPVEGDVKSILNELSRDFNFNYRIDGQRLYINDPNNYQSPNSVARAFVLSPSSGLLGEPTFASADGKKIKDDVQKKKGVKFRSLINPLIQPGSAVSLKGSSIEGIFRVNSVEYSGSWRGTKWEAVCHCSKLNATEV